MSDYFQGKTGFVTGSGSGLGRAQAHAFAKRGAQIVVADLSVKDGEETVKQITAAGGKAVFIEVDVTKSDSVAALVERTTALSGRLDFAVNNAGVDPEIEPEPEWDDKVFDFIINVNVRGVFNCMKHEIRQMLKQSGGAIVNLSSIAGVVGVGYKPIYAASKHAVLGFTRSAALQYGSKNIRVNAVCPGSFKTPMLERNLVANPANIELVARSNPMGRVGDPAELANAVVYLCSDLASYMTGQPMIVDAGMTAA